MARKVIPEKINTFSYGFHGGRGIAHLMPMPDQHNEIELNLILQGEMILQHGTSMVTITPGDTIIYWAAIPHQIILVQPQTEVAFLALPLSWFLSWNLPSLLSHKVLEGEILQIPKEAALKAPVSDLTQWTADLEKKTPELNKIVELELEAYFRRLVLHFDRLKFRRRPSRQIFAKNQYRQVQQMVKFMTERFRQPISVPDIASAADLNPEYAMRLFRKCWGMTLWDFLLRQRISEAQRLLALGDDKVLDVAMACGFNSPSRFYSAFKKQCHCSPNVYRRR